MQIDYLTLDYNCNTEHNLFGFREEETPSLTLLG